MESSDRSGDLSPLFQAIRGGNDWEISLLGPPSCLRGVSRLALPPLQSWGRAISPKRGPQVAPKPP